MPQSLSQVASDALITGWDFSTGAVKCLAFDLQGSVLAETRLPTDLYTQDGVSELNLMQLEGQARATTRAMADQLRESGRLQHWRGGGISATHHTSGRIDRHLNQVRRAICWNDQTLAEYHARGLGRLGGISKVQELIGGPWAIRYSLSHLIKDESTLSTDAWQRTRWILPHGPLAAGYLTNRFDVTSVSSAASTGMMDLRTNQWRREMLDALENPQYRERAWANLPRIIEMNTPVGPLSESLAVDLGLESGHRPLLFPTLDDQAAGLVGGGAVDDGQVAIILGNSAVVNSSSNRMPTDGNLDVMRLNWGPYLWMRCYSNGAQFLDRIVGSNPDWEALEKAARAVPAGCYGTGVLPFILSEPSLGIVRPRLEWYPKEPSDAGTRFRASLEALAYLMALGVREHRRAGQSITRITVSGGIAKSELMTEILASVLDHPLERLHSNEGPALGAAVAALASLENHHRRRSGNTTDFTVADAVAVMVRFREPVHAIDAWKEPYRQGLTRFEEHLQR